MKYEIRNQVFFTVQKGRQTSQKQGKDIDKLFDIVDKLASGSELDVRYKDHALSGKYSSCRECHIEPYWLLIYEIFDNVLVLLLSRTGSHSELF